MSYGHNSALSEHTVLVAAHRTRRVLLILVILALEQASMGEAAGGVGCRHHGSTLLPAAQKSTLLRRLRAIREVFRGDVAVDGLPVIILGLDLDQ